MGKSKRDSRSADRHKPGKQVRIHPSITEALGKLAERNATSIPVEANRLIREGLEKMGLWPPTKE